MREYHTEITVMNFYLPIKVYSLFVNTRTKLAVKRLLR